MNLKPQDIYVALTLVTLGDQKWTYVQLAYELSMSASEINAGIKRATRARLLLRGAERSAKPRPVRNARREFLVHGIKYAFPPERGELTRGLPTGYAAPPLVDAVAQPDEPPPVWPDPEGEKRGIAFSPLYPSVPRAARQDPELYELLALVDALRDGRARERKLAIKMLTARLKRS